MNKQKRSTFSSFSLLFIGVLFVSVIGSLTFNSQDAAAWCSNENTDIQATWKKGDGGCVAENYNALPQDVKDWLASQGGDGYQTYIGMAQKCQDGPGTVDGGACLNAVRSCLSRVIDYQNKCTDAGDADGTIDGIADACANGLGLGSIGLGNDGAVDAGDDCSPVSNANESTVNAIEQDLTNKMLEICKGASPKDQIACNDTYFVKPAEQCARKAGLDINNGARYDFSDNWQFFNNQTSDRGYNDMKLTPQEYRDCLREEAMKNANDNEKACTVLGGYYIGSDTIDPDVNQAQRNTTKKGCHTSLRDMNNPAACAAQNDHVDGGTEWVKIDDPTNSNHWECQPKDKSLDPEDPNDGVEQLGVNDFALINGGAGTCGESKTNIISCGDDKSETALKNVLRIFVFVLSFGVGIAAVASIAYSAIRYAGARDNQSDVSLARERIRNTVIGLLLYGFLIAIANWLVPGGIL